MLNGVYKLPNAVMQQCPNDSQSATNIRYHVLLNGSNNFSHKKQNICFKSKLTVDNTNQEIGGKICTCLLSI